MAEQVLIQFRADKDLKQDVSEIYNQLGMDLPTALRMFMAKSKQVRGLPFDLRLPDENENRDDFKKAFNDLRAEALKNGEVSLDEINQEISEVRSKRRRK